MSFTSIVEFSSACPLRLHGRTAKITLCHAQSMKSPISPCVNFGLQIPLPLISQDPRQIGKMLIFYQYNIDYDEHSGENNVSISDAVLKVAR